MKKILSFCAALLIAIVANAAVIEIDNSTADALRLALDAADDGDEIVMAAGTYVESNGDYIAFAGKHVTVKAAEGAEVLIQPQVPVQVTEGGTAHFVNVKFDASRLQELATWYEHLIYPADGSTGYQNKIILEGCEFYGFNINKSMIYCSKTNSLEAVTINNCYFHDCMKSILFIEATEGTEVSIKNSTFENISTDASSYYAGVLDSRATAGFFEVDHCTFYNAQAMNTDYAAVGKVSTPNALVANSIFMLSVAQDGVRAIRDVAEAINCITFNYLKDSGTGIHSSVTKTNCDQVDPAFVDPDNGDFTLGEGSPALTMNGGEPIGDPRWVPAAKLAEPDAAPADPTWPDDQVKAVYSGTYSADCNFGEWGSGTVFTDDTYGKKYVTAALGYFGLEFSSLNCSTMESLHLDAWIADDASIRVVPIHGGTEVGVTVNLVGQQWNSIDIALSEFTGVTDWTNVYQIKIDNAANLTFWLNNVYFYTTSAPAIDEDAPTDFDADFVKALFFHATLKASAEDASGAVKYIVKDEADNEIAEATAASGVQTKIELYALEAGTAYKVKVIAKDDSDNETAPIEIEFTTPAAPEAAPVPDMPEEFVKSLFSEAYTPATNVNEYRQDWWNGAMFDIGYLGGIDQVLLYTPIVDGGAHGWAFDEFDATGFNKLHISIYPLADGTIEIYPVVDGQPEAAYHQVSASLAANQWNEIEFDFGDLPLDKVKQLGWKSYFELEGFLIDNVYFFKEIPAIDITINTGTSFTDAVADEGWWQIMAENDVYSVSLSNISTDEIPGTYPMSEMDADYSFVKVKETEEKIGFVDGEVVVTVNVDNSIDFVGLFLAEDGNYYALNLHYGAIAETTREIEVSEFTVSDLTASYGGWYITGENEEEKIEFALFIVTTGDIDGDWTLADLEMYYSGLSDNGDVPGIFSAAIHSETTAVGRVITADLLCTNNVLYKLTLYKAPETIEREYFGANIDTWEDNTATAEGWTLAVVDDDYGFIYTAVDGVDNVEGTFTLGVELDDYYTYIMFMDTHDFVDYTELVGIGGKNPDGSIDFVFEGKDTNANTYNITIHIPAPDPTAVENTEVKTAAVKVIKNGQLIINREGKIFNAVGARVE